MPPIDGRLVKAKRFPVHAAAAVCAMEELQRLLTEDAAFHVGRKIPDLELSVLHSACSSRPGSPTEIFGQIVKLLIEMGAPINDRDALGQTALHYAVCHQDALKLVEIITDSGAQVDPDRGRDGWTPLHLAAMFGKTSVAIKLMAMGADPFTKAWNGETSEDVAKRFKNHRLADVLHSPRQAHAPTSYPSEFMDIMRKHEVPLPSPIKFKDEHINWRDEDGNSILHYAAWTGNTYLARNLFDSVKGKKLINVVNKKGASPLALAIIASQDKLVEDFFMNKTAKKLIDFTSSLIDTKETITHLLLQYAPFVPPKFVLKRKDLTKEIINAVNANGETPLLHVASRNNMHTVRHILNAKSVKEGQMLDLGARNSKDGKTLLHYLVENKDEENFRTILDREELTSEVANIPDNEGKTPMIYCLTKGSPYMARDILIHPTAKDKFRLDSCHTPDGRSPLHLVAEQNNGSLWDIAVQRKDCDLNATDAEGNTPLMRAVICGSVKILEAWLKDKESARKVDQTLANKEGKTLLMLYVQYMNHIQLRVLLNVIDAKPCINQMDSNGDTAMLIATKLSKWALAKELISHYGLKVGECDDELEGTVDLHPLSSEGQSALTMQMLARVKLERAEQTYNMKKQRVLATEAKKEGDQVWELVKLMLVREKEQHGTTMTQGRDGGSECIKKQFAVAKLIRPQTTEEVVQEFVKLYSFIKRKKPPSANVSSTKPSPASNATPTVPPIPTSTTTTTTPTVTTAVATTTTISPVTTASSSSSSTTTPSTPKTSSPTTSVSSSTPSTTVSTSSVTSKKSSESPPAETSPTTPTVPLPVLVTSTTAAAPKTSQTATSSAVASQIANVVQSVSSVGGDSQSKTVTQSSETISASSPPKSTRPTSAAVTTGDSPKSGSPKKKPSSPGVQEKTELSEKTPDKVESSPNESSAPSEDLGKKASPEKALKVNGFDLKPGKKLVPGKVVSEEDITITSDENGNSPPLAPQRKTKRKTVDTATQTETIGGSGGCICCCTCRK